MMGAKLVRDRTEQHVRPMGVSGHWYKAARKELLPALKRKLIEEALEFAESGEPIELWDVLDVVEAIFALIDPCQESMAAYDEKVARFGAFDKGIMWNPVPQTGGTE